MASLTKAVDDANDRVRRAELDLAKANKLKDEHFQAMTSAETLRGKAIAAAKKTAEEEKNSAVHAAVEAAKKAAEEERDSIVQAAMQTARDQAWEEADKEYGAQVARASYLWYHQGRTEQAQKLNHPVPSDETLEADFAVIDALQKAEAAREEAQQALDAEIEKMVDDSPLSTVFPQLSPQS
jgi:hypothetical protein